jgi:hypothetical protein
MRYGWSCLSTNCVYSIVPMRYSSRLFQELPALSAVAAIQAALLRWPGAAALAHETSLSDAAHDPIN